MGNCQTADVAAVMIQHPDGRVERACWSLTASDVMASNPGHYVAVVSVVVVARRSDSGASSSDGGGRSSEKRVKYLKLLRPDEPLLVGKFYRLVSFEDVLREFGSKRRVRLSKLLAKEEERRRRSKAEVALGIGGDDDDHGSNPSSSELVEEEDENMEQMFGSDDDDGGGAGARMPKHLPWRPTLPTISEISTSSFH